MLHLVQLLGWHELDQAVAGVAVGKQLSVVQQLPVEVVDVEGIVGGDADMRRTDDLDRVVEVRTSASRDASALANGTRGRAHHGEPAGTPASTARRPISGSAAALPATTATDTAVPSGAVPVYRPAGVRWSGKLGAGVLQPQQMHRTREGAGFECRGGGVLDPVDGVAVGSNGSGLVWVTVTGIGVSLRSSSAGVPQPGQPSSTGRAPACAPGWVVVVMSEPPAGQAC